MEYTKESFIIASILFAIFIISIVYEYYNANYANKLIEGFKKKSDPIGNAMKKAFKPMLKPIMNPINKIMGFFTYLGKFFKWIGDIIQCSIETIIGIPNCFVFYLFDIFVGFIMMIIKLFCSFSPTLEKARKMVGKIMKQMDKMLYSMTGFHFLEYPKSIVKKCYKCQNKKMPKMKL